MYYCGLPRKGVAIDSSPRTSVPEGFLKEVADVASADAVTFWHFDDGSGTYHSPASWNLRYPEEFGEMPPNPGRIVGRITHSREMIAAPRARSQSATSGPLVVRHGIESLIAWPLLRAPTPYA